MILCLSHGHAEGASRESFTRAPQDPARSLKFGERVRETIAGGQKKSFAIRLEANQYVHVVLHQRGIILSMELMGPSGNSIAKTWSPAGGHGAIIISEIASVSGDYELKVSSDEAWANPGTFEIAIEELRQVITQDSDLVAAERSFAKALKDSEARSFKTAIEEFTKSLTYWKSVNDRHWQALTLYALGQTHRRSGNAKSAETCFTEALKIDLDEVDWRLKASLLNDLGVNRVIEDSAAGIQLLNESLALFESHADKRGQASSLNNLAQAYGRRGDYRKALELTQKALPLRQSENFQSGVNVVLNNLGLIYDRLGEPYKALDYYTRALEGWQALAKANQLDSPDRLGAGLNGLALASERVGRLDQAAQYYQDALAVPGISKSLRAAILNNRGAFHFSLADYDKAIEYLTEARTTLESLERADKDVKASVLLQIGQVHDAAGRLNEALNYLRLAKSVGPNKPKLSYILTALGDAWGRQGRFEEALKVLREALEIQNEIGDIRGQATVYQEIGDVYALTLNHTEALKHYERALAQWRAVLDRPGEAETLHRTAVVERDRRNLVVALKLSNEATSILESLRTSVSNYQLRTSYFSNHENYYELNIDLNMQLNRGDQSPAAALFGSEKSRARNLIDLLTAAQTDISEGVDAELLRLKSEIAQRLRAKLEAQTLLLSTRHQDSEAKAIAAEISDLIRQHDDVQSKILKTSPRYADLLRPQPLSGTEIQHHLDANTLLLEYSLGEKRSYLFAVTNNSIKGFHLDPRDKIETVANRLVQALTARNREEPNETPQQRKARVDQADKDYAEAANQLSKIVIEPVASLLGQKRLVIVADGALQYVPFSALPISESTAQATNSQSATAVTNVPTTVITNHELVSLPSASVLALQRRELANRKAAPLKLAVLADPVFDLQDSRVATELARPNRKRKGSDATASNAPTPSQNTPTKNENSTLVSALRDVGLNPDGTLRRLSWSRTEASDIARLVAPKQSLKALDFDASRATALSGELSKYQYVHFATHGVLSLEHPESVRYRSFNG